jgi:hypothetical protein
MKNKTYVLFVPDSRGPTVRHDSIESARTEAKRLVDTGCASVMICEFVEGLERVVNTKAMRKNPLPTESEQVPF